MDLRVPDSNGLECLKAVRTTEAFKARPVIGYTHLYVPGMADRAEAAGANAGRMETLYRLIQSAVANR